MSWNLNLALHSTTAVMHECANHIDQNHSHKFIALTLLLGGHSTSLDIVSNTAAIEGKVVSEKRG